MDISDVFDEISNWEEQLIAEGEELGIQKGRELGVEEGRELGILKGAEIGSEIGFYKGCFLVWQLMLENEQMKTRISDRAIKSITSFGLLLDDFELKNIVDEDLMNKLLRLRAKFKVITALSGLRNSLVFSQSDLHDHKNMSF